MEINRKATRVGAFEVCVSTHVSLRMFIMQVLASQLPFLANRNAELAVPPLFWPDNCIKIGGHVALLSGPTVYTVNIVYEATVTAEDRSIRNYIGMTEHSFKTRYADHKQSFEKKKYATKTSLSRYLWKLKEAGIKHSIKWSIMQRARAYRGGSRQCNLCLAEKLCILNADKRFLLNKKSELISVCRHKNKFLC